MTHCAEAHIRTWQRVQQATSLAANRPERALALVADGLLAGLGDDVLVALTELWLRLTRRLAPATCMLAVHGTYRVVVERGPQPLTARIWSALGAPHLAGRVIGLRELTELQPLRPGSPPHSSAT